LKKVGVQVKANGVLPALATHVGDAENSKQHSLKPLFFNMPFIHRTYCLTYRGQHDMFVPLRECMFVRDAASKMAYFSAELSGNHSTNKILSRLPGALLADQSGGPSHIWSHASVPLAGKRALTDTDVEALRGLYQKLRADLY
jgi:hypothetical protein